MGGDMSHYVTRDEVIGRLEPLAEIRDMFRDSIGRLNDGQDRISAQVSEMHLQITRRQDIQNGRLAKVEVAGEEARTAAYLAKDAVTEAQRTAIEAKDAVTEAHRTAVDAKDAVTEAQRTATENTKDIAGLSRAVEAVQTTANHIDRFGCQQGGRHEVMYTALGEAGVVPDCEVLEVSPRQWTRRQWTPRQKAGLAGFAALIAVASPVLIKLIELAREWMQHISLVGVGK
jgi:hypothetical protein